MKKILILALSLSQMLVACGSKDNCKHDLVNGLCLNSQEFPVFREAVSMTIDITEEEVNKEYPGLDLPELSEMNSLEAIYKYKGTVDCGGSNLSGVSGPKNTPKGCGHLNFSAIDSLTHGMLSYAHEDDSYIRGCYLATNETIQVNYLTHHEAPSRNLRCREAYYVLGHELLHFILNYHIYSLRGESVNHTHPVFIDFSEDEDGVVTLVEGVETRMYFAVALMCEKMVGLD